MLLCRENLAVWLNTPFTDPKCQIQNEIPNSKSQINSNDQNPKCFRLGHPKLEFGYCLEFATWKLALHTSDFRQFDRPSHSFILPFWISVSAPELFEENRNRKGETGFPTKPYPMETLLLGQLKKVPPRSSRQISRWKWKTEREKRVLRQHDLPTSNRNPRKRRRGTDL